MSQTNHDLVHLKFDTKNQIQITVPWNLIIQRSNLFKQIHESCEQRQEVQLALERPEKFLVLLHFIIYGEILKDSSLKDDFYLYINDVVYLKVNELEKHFMSMMLNDSINNSLQFYNKVSFVNRDFMLRYFSKNFDCLKKQLIGFWQWFVNWISDSSIDASQLKHIIQPRLKNSKISVDELLLLQEQYPHILDSMMSASDIVGTYFKKVKCVKCSQRVWQISINHDRCYRLSFRSNNFEISGLHEAASWNN
eukprot:TRINITY_DN5086_c0_g1_i2.p2 TRINITY_DN5086_c0_g1~~TRINITY_DN5086_c0_g1_i2.p2  ORF type:complete len:251 (-),score=-0.77 TRINITY_DN5086_c0_g1_i2:461-1213(-)